MPATTWRALLRRVRQTALAMGIAAAFSLAPHPAHAAPSALTRDGLSHADLASCVIVGDLTQYQFSTNDSNTFINRASNRWIYFAYTPRSGITNLGAGKWFQLDYKDAVLDTTGRYHDLHVRFSNVQARWNVNPELGAIRQRMVTCYKDHLSVDVKNTWTYNTSYQAVSSAASAKAYAGLKADVEVWAGGDADDATLTYNLFVTDLDVRDFFTNTYAGTWSESIILGDMFGKVHVESDTYLRLDGGRIYGSAVDENTFKSGFVSRATMSPSKPLRFTWAASNAGTSFFINWSHVITAKASVGGSVAIGTGSSVMLDTPVTEATDGVYHTQTELEAVPGNGYVVTATPAYGYDLAEMTLDGQPAGSDGTVSIPAIAKDHVVCAVFVPRRGKMGIEKASGNTDITDQNACYTLEGATYGVYADEACTQLEKELVTNAQGVSELVEMSIGTHWVRELEAPHGYALDPEAHAVEVTAGGTTLLPLTDVPQTDAVQLLVQKNDAQTGSAQPQGSATLAGARFDVDFYAGTYEQDTLPDTPTRHWVFVTDTQGQVLLDESYLQEGDQLFRNGEGAPVLPLGTVTIRETSAPSGYQLPKEQGLVLRHITSMGSEANVTTYAEPSEEDPTVADEVVRGGICVYKLDAQSRTGLADARFDITNLSEAPVMVDGKIYAPGEVCLTITSGADGRATSGEHALPPGTYELHEAHAPRGYHADPSWSATATIDAQGSFVDLTEQPALNERITVEVPLKAIKSFDGTSQGRSLTAGMFSFELCDGEGKVLQTKENDASGTVVFDPLVFDYRDLEQEHRYLVREVRGTDEEIVYDSHREAVLITLSEAEDGTLKPQVTTDDDGIVFHNRTVSALELPLTGLRGIHGAPVGALMSLLATLALLGHRRLGSRR